MDNSSASAMAASQMAATLQMVASHQQHMNSNAPAGRYEYEAMPFHRSPAQQEMMQQLNVSAMNQQVLAGSSVAQGQGGGQIILVPVYVAPNSLPGAPVMESVPAAQQMRVSSDFQRQHQVHQRRRIAAMDRQGESQHPRHFGKAGHVLEPTAASFAGQEHVNQITHLQHAVSDAAPAPRSHQPSQQKSSIYQSGASQKQLEMERAKEALRPKSRGSTSSASSPLPPMEDSDASSSSASEAHQGSKRRKLACVDKGKKSGTKRVSQISNSARFLWSPALHDQFCSSVFQVGLKHSSAASLIARVSEDRVGHQDCETVNDPQSTKDRKKIFADQVSYYLEEYRRFQSDIIKFHAAENDPEGDDLPFRAGELAAHLTFRCLEEGKDQKLPLGEGETNQEDEAGRTIPPRSAVELQFIPTWNTGRAAEKNGRDPHNTSITREVILPPWMNRIAKNDRKYLDEVDFDTVILPSMKPEEVSSSLGKAMGHLMGLIQSTNYQILDGRIKTSKENEKRSAKQETEATSTVNGQADAAVSTTEFSVLDVDHERASASSSTPYVDEPETVRELTANALLVGSKLNSTLQIPPEEDAKEADVSERRK
jgi:hypothetical protein